MPFVSADEFIATTFDYIVVGGGTAGLVIAARLSEDTSKIVGIIEAGRYQPDMPEINVPGYFGRALGNPEVDWSFMTAPQPGMNGRGIFTPRGKVLGGSSALNFMALSRASADNYDTFESLGNPGWGWQSWLKYFKKSEHMHAASPRIAEDHDATFDPAFHGSSGPVQASFARWHSGLHRPFLSALRSTGVRINGDSMSGHNIGATTTAQSVDPATATRSYSSSAYWVPNASRPNLLLITGAQVTRVVLHGEDLLRATGVEFIKDNSKHVAKVKGEVILSAGSIQTPQLLELSGIGSKEILERAGISVLLDIPTVGENLQDHVYFPVASEVLSTTDTLDELRDPASHDKNWADYQRQEGKYSCIFSELSYLNAEAFAVKEDIENMLVDIAETDISHYSAIPSYQKQLDVHRKWFSDPCHAQAEFMLYPGFLDLGGGAPPPAPMVGQDPVPPVPGKRYHTMMPVLLHTLSRGSTHVSSSDPRAAPTIDPRYLSHPFDLKLLLSAFRFARKLAKAGELGQLFRGYVVPGPEVTDEQIVEHVKNTAQTVNHQIGTASMLPREDGGVVDERLLVYGTANLRVCDASVLPMVSSHPQATVYALAEKAAVIIAGKEEA